MLENLGNLYNHYGGYRAAVRSYYFWGSVFLVSLSFHSISDFSWADKTISVMPSLTGFTIAAFAIIFAMLEPDMLRKLMTMDNNGKSPIVAISATIGHAVVIQISAIILAVSSTLSDLSKLNQEAASWIFSKGLSPELLYTAINFTKTSISTIGLFLTYYGIMLVLASILSIVRMQIIISNASKK